jgi:renalase
MNIATPSGVVEPNKNRESLMSIHYDVLILGAGMAGLSCARRLHAAGKKVLLLEKARGLGGRMASRRTPKGAWDHGAQYFTASQAEFATQITAWQQADCVGQWSGQIKAWDGQTLSSSGPTQRWVGVPAMNAPLRALAEGLDILFEVKVDGLVPLQDGWQLNAGEQSWQARQVVLTAPPEQVQALLPAGHSLHALAASCQMEPCWALLLHCASPINLPFDGLFINHGPLSWLARNSSKPGRGSEENWVLHATSEWSRQQQELSAEQVCKLLGTALEALLIRLPLAALPDFNQVEMTAHRWLFARGALAAQAKPYARSQDGMALAGDWLAGGKVEGAYCSGLALAEALLAD